jgi:hypothetical protein
MSYKIFDLCDPSTILFFLSVICINNLRNFKFGLILWERIHFLLRALFCLTILLSVSSNFRRRDETVSRTSWRIRFKLLIEKWIAQLFLWGRISHLHLRNIKNESIFLTWLLLYRERRSYYIWKILERVLSLWKLWLLE